MEQVLENVVDMQMVEDAGVDKKEQIVNIDFKMVTFSLAGKDYAIDILKIKEIAKAGRFTYVPNSAPFVIGVYNLRGEIIPIIDLRLFFNIPIPERTAEEQESIVIVSFGEQKYGIVVDRIDRVVGIQSSTIQPPHPLFGDINIKYIYGVVENAEHLYILLDVDRIFGVKTSEKYDAQDIALLRVHSSQEGGALADDSVGQRPNEQGARTVSAAKNKDSAPAAQTAASTDSCSAKKSEPAFSFIAESLLSFKGFCVSDINERWAHKRYSEWKKERSPSGVQILNEDDADAFLKPFFSRCSGALWTNEYADAVYAVLPENSAKQLFVWNPGCAAGYESYSLACLLKKRYPAAKIRIYAQDVDLLAVSNAPLLTVQKTKTVDWYDDYLSQTVSGEWTFASEIKDSILFEYHDYTHENSISQVDMVFARDVLSFVPEASRVSLLDDFYEKIRGNGFLIVGDNEVVADRNNWFEVVKDSVITYSKQ